VQLVAGGVGQQGALEVPGRLLVSEQAAGSAAGRGPVGDRLGGPTSGRGQGEVVGQLGQVRLGVVAVAVLERLTDPMMQHRGTARRQARGQHIADQSVSESEPPRRAAGVSKDHAGPNGLVQKPEQTVGGQAGDRRRQAERPVLAGDSQQRQGLPARLGQPPQPALQHTADAVGQGRCPAPRVVRVVLGQHQPSQLAYEEGVAPAAPVHGGGQRGARHNADHSQQELGHLGLGEPADRQPRALAGQHSRVELAFPVGANHQQPVAAKLTGQEGEQLQRGRIGPMEVVKHHQQRPGGRSS
jgi:hypothetical protein